MQTRLFHYHLPKIRIAQQPMIPRDHSRLLVLDPLRNRLRHTTFRGLEQFLFPGDVLVFNDSKVFKARLFATKVSGGRVEIFLLKPVNHNLGEALLRGHGLRPDDRLMLSTMLQARILRKEGAFANLQFRSTSGTVQHHLQKMGIVPLPPYIHRPASLHQYNTVYAKEIGSVAAPTAGLHFTTGLLQRLQSKGVQMEMMTLHVGMGTFAPVKSNRIEDHHMHPEEAIIDPATAHRLNAARQEGRRIIAVGTTTVRTLEAFTDGRGRISSGTKDIALFIAPGYRFRCIDGMVTNFHLPSSTLIMLVSALAGRRRILDAYRIAVQQRYRFYSFGDAMLILPSKAFKVSPNVIK